MPQPRQNTRQPPARRTCRLATPRMTRTDSYFLLSKFGSRNDATRQQPMPAIPVFVREAPILGHRNSHVNGIDLQAVGAVWQSGSKDGQNACVWREELFLGVCSKMAKIWDEY